MTVSRSRVPRLLLAGILVALAAGAILVRLTAPGPAAAINDSRACLGEYTALQAGLIGYMRANNLDTVPASDAPTNDMNAPVPLFSSGYARIPRTTWGYGWEGNGRVVMIMTMPDGPSIPPGCYVGDGWPVTTFKPS
jgi:hypothetical protein